MTEVALLLGALALDLALGEPPAAVHPVVGMGRAVAAWERAPVRGAGPQLVYGAALVLATLALFVVPAWLLLGYLREAFWPAYFVLGAWLLKCTFSVRGLFRAAAAVARPLAAGQLEEARYELRSLVSRDTAKLDAPLIAAAAVESVAENSSDSFVAPVFYFVLFGVPGALAYRLVNTCDSMVGYHGKYEYLGKAAARLDDLANFIPARLTALFLVAASALRGAGTVPAWRVAWRYHRATESPNAGWPMSAMAGALGVRLEKVGHYQLGDGRAPAVETITRAVVVAALAIGMAALAAAAVLVVRDGYFA